MLNMKPLIRSIWIAALKCSVVKICSMYYVCTRTVIMLDGWIHNL